MSGHYNITVEWVPDATDDPDAYRLHQMRQHKDIPGTIDVMGAVRALEELLERAKKEHGR